MPTAPFNSKCAHLGCNNPRSKHNGFCIEHGGRDTYNTKYNKTATRREHDRHYGSSFWQTQRIRQLTAYPLCAGCLAEGIYTPAVHVDHVFPWGQIGNHAFKLNIFQSLCHACHSSKTSLESKGTFRQYGQPHKDYVLSDYDRVVIRRISS